MSHIPFQLRPAMLLILALSLALAAGCSRHTLKATPIWDLEYHEARGPAEDRVNLWPLFYWRDPALAILWPLYTATDSGHALAPLYEYERETDRLRLLAIHPNLPAVGQLDSQRQTYRLLTAGWDRKQKEIYCFPFYFQDYTEGWESLLILPAWYHDKNGVWTPLLTWRKDLKGALGPIFLRSTSTHHANQTPSHRYYAPWPLVAWWTAPDERELRAWPLFRYAREDNGRQFHIAELLLRRKWDASSESGLVLAGLGGWKRHPDGSHAHWLAPLYSAKADQAGKRELWTLPLSRKSDGATTETLALAGLGGWERHADGRHIHWLTPLWKADRQADGSSSFFSLPYYHRADADGEQTNILLAGYIRRHTADADYHSLLFPLAHRWRSEDSASHAVLPLYMTRREADGTREFYSLPISWRDDGTLRNLGLFLFHHRELDGQYYSTALWPLAHRWGGADGQTGRALLPLYYDQMTSDGERLMLTPLVSLGRGGERDFTNILGPIFHASREGEQRDRHVLFPLFHSSASRAGHTRTLLPLYHDRLTSSGERLLLTPLASFERGGRSEFTNILGPLYLDHRAGDEHYRTILFPLWHEVDSKDEHFKALLPLAAWSRGKDDRAFYSLLFSKGRTADSQFLNIGTLLFRHSRKPDYVSTDLLWPLVNWDRDLKHESRGWRVFPIASYRRSPTESFYQSMMVSRGRNLTPEVELRAEMVQEHRRRHERATTGRPITTSRQLSSDDMLLGLVHRERNLTATSARKAEHAADAVVLEAATGGDHHALVMEFGERRESRVFPFYFHESDDKQALATLLWRLYDYRRETTGGDSYRRHRVLWRLYHCESLGEHTSTDMFPFLAWDRHADSGHGKFSFAGGLIEYTRDENGRRLRALTPLARNLMRPFRKGEADRRL